MQQHPAPKIFTRNPPREFLRLSDHSLSRAKEINRKYSRSKHQIPPQKARAKKTAWKELAFTLNTQKKASWQIGSGWFCRTQERKIHWSYLGGENILSNSVFFLAQYVSFLPHFQLCHIFKFSLLPLHLSDSFYLFPFSPHYCFCCYSSQFVVSLPDSLSASRSFSFPHPSLLLIFLSLRTGLGAVWAQWHRAGPG